MAFCNPVLFLSSLTQDKTHAKAEVFLEKLKVQYQRSATENILIAFNLSTPEYLKLTGFPAKLIVSLYEHNSIEQRIQNPTGKDYPGKTSLQKLGFIPSMHPSV